MKTFKEFISEALVARAAVAALRQLARNRGTAQRVTQNLANQGIQPTKKLLSFRTAYHGTSVPIAAKIKKTGFKPGTRYVQDLPLPKGERIYVTTSKKNAENYANQAGPEKYGSEVETNSQFDFRRSPIRSRQVTVDRSTPEFTTRNVGLFDKIINKITRRNKPEILDLKVADRLDTSADDMVRSKTTRPNEFTISRSQADTGLRNAEALRNINQGRIRVKRTNGNNFEIA